MTIFRYRKPSLSTLLGVTAATRRVKRSLGISQVQGFIEPSRLKQKIKYRAGLYTPVARAIRQTARPPRGSSGPRSGCDRSGTAPELDRRGARLHTRSALVV